MPRLLVACDYDGTMAPIVANPDDARPLAESAAALRELAALPSTTAALISGRALRDLATLSRMPAEVHLVGSHGSEFDTGFVHAIDDAAKALLGRIKDALSAIAAEFPGVAIEIKPASSAVHFRNAPISGQEVLELLRPLLHQTGLYGGLGRKVIEVHAPRAGKGNALMAMLTNLTPGGLVCMGDDENDRSVFKVASKSSIPHLRVGVGSTEVPPDLFDHCDMIVDGPGPWPNSRPLPVEITPIDSQPSR